MILALKEEKSLVGLFLKRLNVTPPNNKFIFTIQLNLAEVLTSCSFVHLRIVMTYILKHTSSEKSSKYKKCKGEKLIEKSIQSKDAFTTGNNMDQCIQDC